MWGVSFRACSIYKKCCESLRSNSNLTSFAWTEIVRSLEISINVVIRLVLRHSILIAHRRRRKRRGERKPVNQTAIPIQRVYRHEEERHEYVYSSFITCMHVYFNMLTCSKLKLPTYLKVIIVSLYIGTRTLFWNFFGNNRCNFNKKNNRLWRTNCVIITS